MNYQEKTVRRKIMWSLELAVLSAAVAGIFLCVIVALCR